MKTVKNLPQSLDEIMIGQIIFDHSEWVSLWGYAIRNGKKERMDYILTFEMLNKLLRLSGEAGDRVQMLVVERLEKGVEEPSVIDLAEKFGGPVRFAGCRIDVSPTGVEDAHGNWREDPACLSIDEVCPRLEAKSAAVSQPSLCRQNLSTCIDVLAVSYQIFLEYQEVGFDEAAALKKAELEDDLKYKMAFYAWSMNHREQE
jgi:hypothetical protein